MPNSEQIVIFIISREVSHIMFQRGFLTFLVPSWMMVVSFKVLCYPCLNPSLEIKLFTFHSSNFYLIILNIIYGLHYHLLKLLPCKERSITLIYHFTHWLIHIDFNDVFFLIVLNSPLPFVFIFLPDIHNKTK